MIDQHTVEQVKSYGIAAGAITLPQLVSGINTATQLIITLIGLVIALMRLEKDWSDRQRRKHHTKSDK